jgi:hypothetical protein
MPDELFAGIVRNNQIGTAKRQMPIQGFKTTPTS